MVTSVLREDLEDALHEIGMEVRIHFNEDSITLSSPNGIREMPCQYLGYRDENYEQEFTPNFSGLALAPRGNMWYEPDVIVLITPTFVGENDHIYAILYTQQKIGLR